MPGRPRQRSACATSAIFDDRLCRLLIAVLLIGAALARPMPVLAGTFAVTRFDDPTPDGCAANGCSLREAVIAANSSPGPDVITLGSGVYSLSIEGEDDDAQTGDIDITDSLTISGLSASATTIDAGYNDRAFEVITGTVQIERLKIRNGLAGTEGGAISNRSNGVVAVTASSFTANGADAGGAIMNEGVATITASTFTGNDANTGGAIMNRGTLTLIDSTASANTAGNGGGINNTGMLEVIGSAIIANTVMSDTVSRSTRGDGGGIYNSGFLSTAALTIANSTISGNNAWIDGGGIYTIYATVRLNNVSIANNTADSDSNGTGDGGGIARNPDSGTVFLQNSLIAANSDRGGQAPDCATSKGVGSSQLTSQGYNLIQNLIGCTIGGTTTGNIIGQNPQIGPLHDNGGATLTHALLNGSLAIDGGNPAGCKDSQAHTLTTDQRGYPRAAGRRCDIGAYEVVSLYRIYLPGVRR